MITREKQKRGKQKLILKIGKCNKKERRKQRKKKEKNIAKKDSVRM